jgi:hypothetical protein
MLYVEPDFFFLIFMYFISFFYFIVAFGFDFRIKT